MDTKTISKSTIKKVVVQTKMALQDVFDSKVPKQVHKLPFNSNRIILNGTIIELPDKASTDKRIFFKVAGCYLNERFDSERVNNLFLVLRRFLEWLFEQDDTSDLRYDLLKKYESYRVRETNSDGQSTGLKKLKTQSSGLKMIKGACRECLKYSKGIFSSFESNYLRQVINFTKEAPSDSVDSNCLTQSFSSQWLRQEMGHEDYLKLSSPKTVTDSFIIAISTLLVSLLDIKLNVINANIRDGEEFSDSANRLHSLLCGIYPKPKASETIINNYACGFIDVVTSTYGKATPSLLKDMILSDLVHSNLDGCREHILDIISTGDSVATKYFHSETRTSTTRRPKGFARMPGLFTPEFMNSITLVEQQLFAIICAWWTVQPKNISDLTLESHHIGIENNLSGSPVFVHCNYYKSRAGYALKRPSEIPLTQIEGKAIYAYIETCKLLEHKGPLVSPKACLPVVYTKSHRVNTLLNLLSIDEFKKVYGKELDRRSASNVAIKAIQLMANKGDFYRPWSAIQKKNGLEHTVQRFWKVVERPVQLSVYTLEGVKNASIYAQSDQYRSGDLQDKRSHSSSTEGTGYMKDGNKEWMDLNGRITRLVLNDVASNLYSEHIINSEKKAALLKARTRVVTENNDIDINIFPLQSTSSMTQDQIIVHDSPEAVIQCIHYFEQFKEFGESLLVINPEFTLNTALPNAIWAEDMLKNGNFSPKSISEGRESYDYLVEHLPNIFSLHLGGLH